MKKAENGTKKAALYDPYLDVMGGGEKHILSILQVLEHEGYEANVFWDHDLTGPISSKLNLRFRNLRFVPNIFAGSSPLRKLQELEKYGILLYVTDGSYFFSSARKNIVFCMVPNANLYRMGFVNRLKTRGFQFIANSSFTRNWLKKWDIDAQVIYPYVSNDLLKTDLKRVNKDKIILSVGRFFPHLHSKKHEEIIKAFDSFSGKEKGYTLVLAGGIKEEDAPYLEELKNLIGARKDIRLEPNVPYERLLTLYRSARLFWHFAGYGVDEEEHPHLVEHLGMTPLEAMAAGCVPFCYRAGGPKEIVTDGANGYLFADREEIVRKSIRLLDDETLYRTLQDNGQRFVRDKFGYRAFEDAVKKTLL
jgi:glycosyltransferase involved in cell wall biosynthesis